MDNTAVLQALGLIENRQATGCMPPSPLRNTFNPATGVYQTPYNYSSTDQLLQRLQTLSGYTPPSQFTYGNYTPQTPYPFQYPIQPQPVFSPPNVNSYTLQPPPNKKLPPSPLVARHNSPIVQKKFTNNTSNSPKIERKSSPIVQPETEERTSNRSSSDSETHFIKPLAQVGTLTTTDYDGRVRVIVPVPSGAEDAGELLRALRMNDDYPRPIQRSTSEKVPNRSELMSQVQRTQWARHTTK